MSNATPYQTLCPLRKPWRTLWLKKEWGPKLNLEYPTLTGSATRPFVLFKIVLKKIIDDNGPINPGLAPNNEGMLAEQNLRIDSLQRKDSIQIQRKVDSKTNEQINEIKLYPNPTSKEFVYLEIKNWRENSFYYSISNSVGQVLIGETEITERINKINIQHLSKGVYQVHIVGKNKSINLQLVVL